MESNLALPGPSSTLSRIHETSAKFQRYKILLRRRWWFLMLTAAIGVCTMALKDAGKPQSFSSLAKLVAGGRVVGTQQGAGTYHEYLNDFYGTIIETLESSEMRRRALERVSALNPDLKESEVDIRVLQNRGSAIFNVAAVGTDQKYTRVYLDALLDEFMLLREQDRDLKKNKALVALNQAVKERSSEVEDLLNRLTEFKKNNNIVMLNNGQNQAAEFLSQVEMEKKRLELQLSDLDLLLEDLDSALHQRERGGQATTMAQPTTATQATNGTVDTATAGASRSGAWSREAGGGFTRTELDYLEEQRRLSAINRERNELLASFLPQHPKVLELDRLIERTKGSMADLQKEILDEARGQKTGIERRIKTLDSQIDEYSKTAIEVGAKLAEYERLSRAVEESGKTLDEMRELVKRFEVGEEMSSDTVTIMERASVAVEDVSDWMVPLLTGLAVGLGVGIVTLLLFDRLDDRMNSFSEFQALFPNEAILGQIPEQRQRGDVALLRSNDDRHLYAEAFRNVRSSVLFKNWRGKPPKTIMVTSAVPNEGKTTITSNLAITMALAGARVLLADCDLRRGGVSELFKLPSSPGLSDVLRGKSHWRDAVQETSTRNLDLLARGEVFDQTSEMLLSKTAEEMLREMSEEYDYIMFDSAPVLVADDTGSFAPKMDTLLFVVRMSSTMARLSAKALDLLYDRQVNVGGVILNRSSSSLKEYTYYNYASYYYTPKQPDERTNPAQAPANS
jgi:polysaccharide biosynthesis transport protein